MKCPKCNAEIPDGYLYCPDCGEEVIIVSDFEINLEDNIDTAVFADTAEFPDLGLKKRGLDSSIIDNDDIDIENDEDITIIDNPDDYNNKTEDTKKKNVGIFIPKPLFVLGIVAIILIVITTVFVVNEVRDYTSFDVQYSEAKELYEEADYSNALKKAKRAISLKNEEVKGYVLLADIYCAQNNYDAAIAVLIDALDDNPSMIALYDRIIKCYEAEGDYAAIHSLLINSEDQSLIDRYPSYFAKMPEFSLADGEYVAPQSVLVSAESAGTIYYTTDGSVPTKDSFVYSESIPLEEGNNVITAIFINEYGISSDYVTHTYNVKSDIPDIPRLITSSGSYNVPNPIGVIESEGLRYYYVYGSSVPSENDNLYELPLFMPFGKSQYTFIAQNENGTFSECVTADYEFSFAAVIDKAVAEYAVSYRLIATGDTTIGYTYVSESAYSKDSVSYYIVYEMNGNRRTGRIFAVDSTSGALYRVSTDLENKEYIFKAL